MDKLHEFSENFKNLLIEWKKQYNDIAFVPDVSADIFCPFLEDIKSLQADQLNYIVVGDNPGQKEQLRQYYFAGRTSYIRLFFESLLGKDWNKKVLFLNKTPIFSNDINALKTKNRIAIENTQKAMAELIVSLHENLKECYLWIVGSSELEKGIFSPFWNVVDKVPIEQKERICLLKHPSYKCFANDILETINKYKSLKGKTK